MIFPEDYPYKFREFEDGDLVRIFVRGEEEIHFKAHKLDQEWECSPNNDREAWEKLAKLAGFDPDDEELLLELNMWASFIPY